MENGFKTIADHFADVFPGKKIRKVPVDAALGCPGRCSYCNNASFSPAYADLRSSSITQQLRSGIEFTSVKGKADAYLAYFQSYTNTYSDTEKLIAMYREALQYPGVVGLDIATRPDCLKPDLLDWFEENFGTGASSKKRPYLLMEIGIESTCDKTLERIRRGHDFDCAARAVRELARRGIDVGAHLIVGLPGEQESDFIDHARRVSELPVKTLKLHQLQIIKGTPMAEQYKADPSAFRCLDVHEYARIVVRMLRELRPDIALDRFVSQAPKDMVIAPSWGLKPEEFNRILREYL